MSSNVFFKILNFSLSLIMHLFAFELIYSFNVFFLWIKLDLLCQYLNFSNFILLLLLNFNSFFVLQALYYDLLKDVLNNRNHCYYPFLVEVRLPRFFFKILVNVVLIKFAPFLSFFFLNHFLCLHLSFPLHTHIHWIIKFVLYFWIRIEELGLFNSCFHQSFSNFLLTFDF